MKFKKVAVASLMLCTASAFADSGVTLYGVLDAGILSLTNTSGGTGYLPSTVNKGTVTKMQDGGIGGSNFGFKGCEDLGSGLKANFMLQGNINVTNGSAGGPNSSTPAATSMFNQYASVGLSGNFGSVDVGRQVSPMYYAFASTDARAGKYFGSALTALVGLNSASGAFIGNNSNAAFGTVYNDNAIVYQSPKIGGAVFGAEYAMGNSTGSALAQEALTVQFDANNGLKLSGLYYSGNGNGYGATATTNTNRLTEVGALYSTGPYTVSFEYFQARNPANSASASGSNSLNMWTVGGGYKLSANTNLTAGYYKITDNTNSGNTASQFAAGLDYALSKQTLIYFEAASTTNNGANMNLSPIYGNAVAANTGNTAYMVGLRKSF
jgi:predicted porin